MMLPGGAIHWNSHVSLSGSESFDTDDHPGIVQNFNPPRTSSNQDAKSTLLITPSDGITRQLSKMSSIRVGPLTAS